MGRTVRAKSERMLTQAEGYLELGMPQQALAMLDRLDSEQAGRFEANYLRGLALRELHRYEEAIAPLEEASRQSPPHIGVWLALGWCLKRMEQLPRAIDALERARRAEPNNGLVHYNLACYYCLAGQRNQSLELLARALELEPTLRHLVAHESDFDPLRNDPLFQSIVQATGADSSTTRKNG